MALVFVFVKNPSFTLQDRPVSHSMDLKTLRYGSGISHTGMLEALIVYTHRVYLKSILAATTHDCAGNAISRYRTVDSWHMSPQLSLTLSHSVLIVH